MQGFQYSKPIDIRYADIDMMGHVNNAKYLTFIEHARSHYFQKACNWDWNKLGMVLARTEIDFKAPVLLHHKPVVWIRTTRLGQTSFTQENIIAETGQPKQIYATAISTMVHVDFKTGRPLPIPEQIKKAIKQFEEGHD